MRSKSITHKKLHKSLLARLRKAGLVQSALIITESNGVVYSSGAGTRGRIEQAIVGAMRGNPQLAANIKNAVTQMEAIRDKNLQVHLDETGKVQIRPQSTPVERSPARKLWGRVSAGWNKLTGQKPKL